MKQFKKLPVFLAQVSVATGILCTSAFATDRGAVPDANTVMQGLGSNSSVDSIVKPIMGIFGSVYDAVIALGIALLILSVVFAAIGFSAGNGGKREESKMQLFYALAAAAGIGAAVSIATAFLKIGASI